MKTSFYDVKTRQLVEEEIVEKIVYGEKGKERYAVKGKTPDGRNLTKFVSKAKYDSISV